MKTTVNAGDKKTLAVIVFGSIFGAVWIATGLTDTSESFKMA